MIEDLDHPLDDVIDGCLPHERSPSRHDIDQPALVQHAKRLAHHRATQAEFLGQQTLGWKKGSRRKVARQNLAAEERREIVA